jgi:hypothetical protein
MKSPYFIQRRKYLGLVFVQILVTGVVVYAMATTVPTISL